MSTQNENNFTKCADTGDVLCIFPILTWCVLACSPCTFTFVGDHSKARLFWLVVALRLVFSGCSSALSATSARLVDNDWSQRIGDDWGAREGSWGVLRSGC